MTLYGHFNWQNAVVQAVRRSGGHTGSYIKLGRASKSRIQIQHPDPAAYRIEAREARLSANLEDLNPVIPTATASHESL